MLTPICQSKSVEKINWEQEILKLFHFYYASLGKSIMFLPRDGTTSLGSHLSCFLTHTHYP